MKFHNLDFKKIAQIAKEELDFKSEERGDTEIEFHKINTLNCDWKNGADKEAAKYFSEELNKASKHLGIESYCAPCYGGYMVWVRYS